MKLQGTSLILRHDSHHVTMAYKEKHTPSYFGGQIVLWTKLPAYSHPATLPFWERLSKTKSPQCFFLNRCSKKKNGTFMGKIGKFQRKLSQRWCSKTVHLPMLQRRSQPGANPSSWIHLEKNARKKFTRLSEKILGFSYQGQFKEQLTVKIYLCFFVELRMNILSFDCWDRVFNCDLFPIPRWKICQALTLPAG